MSNSKVRKALEAKERNEKKFNSYKRIESVIINYQMCKAHFNDMSASIIGIVERILKQKYNLPWQSKIIAKATRNARGKRNPLISIPQFKYEEYANDILSKYVKSNFNKMVADQKTNNNYPFAFRDIVEKYT